MVRNSSVRRQVRRPPQQQQYVVVRAPRAPGPRLRNTRKGRVVVKASASFFPTASMLMSTGTAAVKAIMALATNDAPPTASGGYPSGYMPPMPGEFHLPFHNFTGPGTRLKERLELGIKPMNKVDAASLIHDQTYGIITDKLKSGEITKEEAARQVRQADQDLICTVTAMPPNEAPPDNSAKWVNRIMSMKIYLEDMGMLNKLKFIGQGV